MNRSPRSLKIAPEKMAIVQEAFQRSGLSQYAFGTEAGSFSRSTTRTFLKGGPVDRTNFIEFCTCLGLDWQDIAGLTLYRPLLSSTENELQKEDSELLLSCGRETSLDTKDSDRSEALRPSFYIERNPIEADCCKAVLQSGSLVRLRGPQQFGKTSVIKRILVQASETYHTVLLSFNLANLTNTTGILKWFCAAISQALDLPNQLTSYWDDIFGPLQSTTIYFENYLLKSLEKPLILVLDDLDIVFENPEIQDSFCRLLRHWNDLTTAINHRAEIWQRLSLVLVHATDKYSSLDINYSPLAGIGSEFMLPEFSEKEIDELVKHYKLSDLNIKKIGQYFGGHPYLVRCAFDYLQQQRVSLDYLMKIAATEKSPFGNHLRGHLDRLQQNPELSLGFKEVVTSKEPVRVNSSETFRLQSMGLVKIEGDLCSPSCELYRQYFSLRLQEKRRPFAALFDLIQPSNS